MATTVTVITNINRTYLKNKTKDEIIDLLLYILDTRCEADAKIEKQDAEIKRLEAAIEEALSVNVDSDYPDVVTYTDIEVKVREILEDVLKRGEKGLS